MRPYTRAGLKVLKQWLSSFFKVVNYKIRPADAFLYFVEKMLINIPWYERLGFVLSLQLAPLTVVEWGPLLFLGSLTTIFAGALSLIVPAQINSRPRRTHG